MYLWPRSAVPCDPWCRWRSYPGEASINNDTVPRRLRTREGRDDLHVAHNIIVAITAAAAATAGAAAQAKATQRNAGTRPSFQFPGGGGSFAPLSSPLPTLFPGRPSRSACAGLVGGLSLRSSPPAWSRDGQHWTSLSPSSHAHGQEKVSCMNSFPLSSYANLARTPTGAFLEPRPRRREQRGARARLGSTAGLSMASALLTRS